MGYRSEVSLVLKKDVLSNILSVIPNEMNELIKYADKFKKQGDYVLLYWSYIKWYKESDSSVGKLWSQLFKNDSDDFYCLEIGEDTNHIVEEGGLWDNPWLTSVQRSIYIEDCGKDVELDAFQ